MSTLTIQIPDDLRKQAEEFAEQKHMSFDQLVSRALRLQVSPWMIPGYIEERSKRGSYARLQEIMSRAPDVKPEPHDRL